MSSCSALTSGALKDCGNCGEVAREIGGYMINTDSDTLSFLLVELILAA